MFNAPLKLWMVEAVQKMGGWQRWLNAVVLKTINGKTFGGSNPSPSAYYIDGFWQLERGSMVVV